MKNEELSFKEKIKLYKDLLQFIEKPQLKDSQLLNQQQKDLLIRLKKWGKDLKIRKLYYDM